MYAVIFRATIKQLDQDYDESAARMRTLAIENYGCLEFMSMTEGDQEIAISYWPSNEAIMAWRNGSEHKQVQAIGAKRWYRDYRVEVTKIERDYHGGGKQEGKRVERD